MPGVSESPSKPAAPAATRQSISANLKMSGPMKELSVDDFAAAFFRKPLLDPECTKHIPKGASSLVRAIVRCGVEKAAYQPTCDLLNDICDKYAKLHGVAVGDQLAFVVHADHPQIHHPDSYTAEVATQKPDLVMTRKQLALLYNADIEDWVDARGGGVRKPAVSLPFVRSIVEGKGSTDPDAHFQAAAYLGSVMQARPDLIGCFGLALASAYYRLLWCDVSGVYYTSKISWAEDFALPLLVQYIHQLHTPLLDPTIRLQTLDTPYDRSSFVQWERKSYASSPVWLVDDKDGVVHVVRKILSVGPPWSRMNWVARATHRLTKGHEEELPAPIIIKDSFIRKERADACTEGDIIAHIHRKGPVPGVVSMASDFRVHRGAHPIGNVQLPPGMDDALRFPTRVRYRLFLREYLNDHIFTTCPSVLDFLKVLYDVLELSRNMHEEHDVTHRDISPFNILRGSEVLSDPPAVPDSTRTGRQPVFIRRLLSYNDDKPFPNTPFCVLIDFDNAFCADRATGAMRTAQAGFVARAISMGRMILTVDVIPRVLTLTGAAKDAYLHFFGQEAYELASAFHDNVVQNVATSAKPAPHLPRHEAESCFWVALWYMLRAYPAHPSIATDDTTAMSSYFRMFESHRIKASTDSRVGCFLFDLGQWESMLHPDLRSLAPFIMDLARVVRPEYGIVQPPPDKYHLHEAMQRIILQKAFELQEAKTPLDISTTHQRIVTALGPADIGLAATAPSVHASRSARGDADSSGQPGQPGKRRRTDSCHAPGASIAATDGSKKKSKPSKDASPPPGTRRSQRQRRQRGEANET